MCSDVLQFGYLTKLYLKKHLSPKVVFRVLCRGLMHRHSFIVYKCEYYLKKVKVKWVKRVYEYYLQKVKVK